MYRIDNQRCPNCIATMRFDSDFVAPYSVIVIYRESIQHQWSFDAQYMTSTLYKIIAIIAV